MNLNIYPYETTKSPIIYAYDDIRKSGISQISECDVFNEVMSWKKNHRPPLIEKEVGNHIRSLSFLGWLDVSYCEDMMVSEDDF